MRCPLGARPQARVIWVGLEIAVLMIAMIQFALATWSVFRNSSQGRVWVIAFISGSVLLFVFYAHTRLWIEAVLACGALAAAGQINLLTPISTGLRNKRSAKDFRSGERTPDTHEVT